MSERKKSALDNLLEKDRKNEPIPAIEEALLTLWKCTSGFEQMAMDGMADIYILRHSHAELLEALEKIAAGNPAKVGGWLSDVEMADIARATLAIIKDGAK